MQSIAVFNTVITLVSAPEAAITGGGAQMAILMGLGVLLLPVLIVLGFLTVFAACVYLLPRELGRGIVWGFLRLIYRIRLHGLHNIPSDRGALLVANHVSWLDGVLMLLSPVDRQVKSH